MQGKEPRYVAQIALANRGDLEVTPAVKALAMNLYEAVNETLVSRCGDEPGIEVEPVHHTASGDGGPAIRIISNLECAVGCALHIIFEQNLIEAKWMPGAFFPIQHGIIPAPAGLTLVQGTSVA